MDTIIEKLASALTQYPSIRFATIFGSFANGRVNSESDVDIAIAANTPLSGTDKRELIDALALLTGRSIDLVDLNVAEGPVLQQALARGHIIKCLDRPLYARLILKMFYSQADDMRYRRRILDMRQEAWT